MGAQLTRTEVEACFKGNAAFTFVPPAVVEAGRPLEPENDTRGALYDFHPPMPPGNDSPAQKLMQFPPLVAVYESIVWRRNPVFYAATGMRFDEELACIRLALAAREDARILDVASGSGCFSRPLAQGLEHGNVWSFDLSRPMLDYARKRAAKAGIGNLAHIRGDAMDQPFADGIFGGAVCDAAIHLMPRPEDAAREVFRVLEPGARFVVVTFRKSERFLYRWLLGPLFRILKVRASKHETLEALFRNAGFEDLEIHYNYGIWLIASGRKPLSVTAD